MRLCVTPKATEPADPPQPSALVSDTDLDQIAVGVLEATAILPRPERRGAAGFGDRLTAVGHPRLERGLDGRNALRGERDEAVPRSRFVLPLLDEELRLDQPPADRVRRRVLTAPA